MGNSIKIYTDGGARGNPGKAAVAFVVVENGKIVYKEALYIGNSTNNEAEYRAVLIALYWLKKNYKKIVGKDIIFHLDSQLVVRQLTGFYKIKSNNLKPLFKDVMDLRNSLNKLKLFFISIKREKNRLADKLVNLKLDENIV